MSTPVPGSGTTESVPAWVSPAKQDAARAASIESVLPEVDGVASVFPPAGAELSGLVRDGVRVSDERVEVHIIAEYGRSLQTTADDIDQAVHPLLDGRDLQIVVDDILLPGEQLPDPEPAPRAEVEIDGKAAAATDLDPQAHSHVEHPDDVEPAVTVSVAPEAAAEVTIDQHGAVQVEVPAAQGGTLDAPDKPLTGG